MQLKSTHASNNRQIQEKFQQEQDKMLFLQKCLVEMYLALDNLGNVHVLPIRLCNHTNSALLSYRTYSNT